MIAPGMKVARAVATAPGTFALGKVMSDGQNVVWHEIVDHEGRPASAYGGMWFAKTPKPLEGNEVPCPPEFADLVH